MKYILDFDRVLFDHDTLQAVMDEQRLNHLYARPELWDEINAHDFLYPDVIPFLSRYPKENLAIVSAFTARIGAHAKPYQERKLLDSNIAQYVSEVVVMDGLKAPHVARLAAAEPAFFVDDKRQYVEEVYTTCPQVTCLQLLRSGATRTKNDVTSTENIEIKIIENLTELSDIIASSKYNSVDSDTL